VNIYLRAFCHTDFSFDFSGRLLLVYVDDCGAFLHGAPKTILPSPFSLLCLNFDGHLEGRIRWDVFAARSCALGVLPGVFCCMPILLRSSPGMAWRDARLPGDGDFTATIHYRFLLTLSSPAPGPWQLFALAAVAAFGELLREDGRSRGERHAAGAGCLPGLPYAATTILRWF